MTRLGNCWAACALILFVSAPSLRPENLVTVRSVADPVYAAARKTDEGLRRETFVVVRGRFFGGVTQDRTMERLSFEKIVQLLAHDLRRQEYYPAAVFTSADLVLLVHWGATVPSVAEFQEMPYRDTTTVELTEARDRYEAAIGNTGEPLDIEGANRALADMDNLMQARNHEAVAFSNDTITQQFVGRTNAELLGLSAELSEEKGSLFSSGVKAETVNIMVKEERYFVVIVAFDAQAMRATGKLKRVWLARLSTRAAGVNFVTALDRMSQAGGRYFGTRVPGVPFETVKPRKEKIVYGDLEVIELGVQ